MLSIIKRVPHCLLLSILLMMSAAALQGLLVLYLTEALQFSNISATNTYVAYGALLYTASLLGGFLVDRYFHHRLSLIVGSLFSAIGLFLVHYQHMELIYWGLALFTLGNGMVFPLGMLFLNKEYAITEPERTGAFTLSYTCLNIGFSIGIFLAAYLAKLFGFQVAIVFAACVVLLQITIAFNHRVKTYSGVTPTLKKIMLGGVLICIYVLLAPQLIKNSVLCQYLVIIVGILLVLFLCILTSLKRRQGKVQVANRLMIFIFLLMLSIVFWAFYMLQPTVITLFIQQHVDRSLFSINFPTASIMGLNGLFILLLGPLLTGLWLRLAHRDIHVPVSFKFGFSLLLIGMAFLMLILGISFAASLSVTLFWVVLALLFISLAEVMIAPTGYSLIGKLIEKEYQGLMLGMWRCKVGIGTAISGQIAILIREPNPFIHLSNSNELNHLANGFMYYMLIAVIFSIVSFLIYKMRAYPKLL